MPGVKIPTNGWRSAALNRYRDPGCSISEFLNWGVYADTSPARIRAATRLDFAPPLTAESDRHKAIGSGTTTPPTPTKDDPEAWR